MKKYLFLSLLAIAVVFIAACAPKEGPEEGALAGQASGQTGMVKSNVQSCTETDTGVTGTDNKGKPFTYTNDCRSSTKVREYFCASYSAGGSKSGRGGKMVNNVVKTEYFCASGEQCQGGACVSSAVCGNNIKEGTEVCDGSDLGGVSCNQFMKSPAATGTLTCLDDCSGFDFSGCEAGEEAEIAGIEQVMPPVTPPPAQNVQIDGTATTVTTTAAPAGSGQIEVVVVAGDKPLTSKTVPGTAQSVDLSGVSIQTSGSKIVVTGLAGEHCLYIPDGTHGGVRKCPAASNLGQVSLTCSGGSTVSYADCQAGQNNCQLMGGYYKMCGFTGSGAQEAPLCTDTDSANDVMVGGKTTLVSSVSIVGIYTDSCVGDTKINETWCTPDGLNVVVSSSSTAPVCPPGTSCYDPDGVAAAYSEAAATNVPAACQ